MKHVVRNHLGLCVRVSWQTRSLDTSCLFHIQLRRRHMRWRRGGSSGGSLFLTMQQWRQRERGWWWPRRDRLSLHTWTAVLWSSLAQSPRRWRRQVGQRCCWEIRCPLPVTLYVRIQNMSAYTEPHYVSSGVVCLLDEDLHRHLSSRSTLFLLNFCSPWRNIWIFCCSTLPNYSLVFWLWLSGVWCFTKCWVYQSFCRNRLVSSKFM